MTVFDIAFGLDRARTDDLAGQGPLLRESLNTEEHLRELQDAGLFDLYDLAAAIAAASDTAIEQAFTDAHILVSLADGLDAIQHFAGRDVGGLASISELSSINDPTELAGLVRTMLLMRPLIPEGALQEIADAVHGAAPTLRTAIALVSALPHLAAYLTPDGAQRLAELSEPDRDAVIAEVKAYLSAHPDLSY